MKLDPNALFERIAADIPADLHKELFVTGSLAAAYHFRTRMEGYAVNTKDADVVIHPAGNETGCRQMAIELLNRGWTKHFDAHSPQSQPHPAENLPAIRLYPPDSHDYFLEILGLPQRGQKEPKAWMPIEMNDGWYGLPCFRFFNIISLHRLKSEFGIEYASPSMMALANLLSHPEVGAFRIESGDFKGLLRSAKDLGRVIALARLAGRPETEKWPSTWLEALKTCFPNEWKTLALRSGAGLRELLDDEDDLEEARKTTEAGILKGMNVTVERLRDSGERLFLDAIYPLLELASKEG
jgi:hypothetical protein